MIVADLTTATLAALRSAIAAVTRVPYEQVLISSAYNVPVDANFDPLLSVSFFLLLKKGSGESITPSIFAGVLDRLYGGEETILEVRTHWVMNSGSLSFTHFMLAEHEHRVVCLSTDLRLSGKRF